MTAVVNVKGEGATVAVADKGGVAVLGKECGARLVQPGASHEDDESLTLVVGLAHPVLTVHRVVDPRQVPSVIS